MMVSGPQGRFSMNRSQAMSESLPAKRQAPTIARGSPVPNAQSSIAEITSTYACTGTASSGSSPARTEDEASFDQMLQLSITEIRTQNAPYLLRGAIANRVFGAKAWEFVRRNWDPFNERFPSNSIVRMLDGLRDITDETLATDVQGFFAEHEVPQGAKQLAQHLERQKAGVALRQREGANLAAALKR